MPTPFFSGGSSLLGAIGSNMSTLGSIGSTVSSLGGLFGIGAAKQRREAFKLYKKQADYQYKLQQMASDAQQQRQIDMWQMNNQYNDPVNQRARLEAAGLLGASMFSNGMGYEASAPSVSTPGAPGGSLPSSDQLFPGSSNDLRIAQALQTAAQVRDVNSSADLKDEQATTEGYKRDLMEAQSALQIALEGNSKAETALKEFDLAFRRDTRNLNIRQLQNNVEIGLSSINKLNEEVDSLSLSNTYYRATLDDRIQQLSNEVALQQVEIALRNAQIPLTDAERRRVLAMIPLINEQVVTEREKPEYYKSLAGAATSQGRAAQARARIDESYFEPVFLKAPDGTVVKIESPFVRSAISGDIDVEQGKVSLATSKKNYNWYTYNQILNGINTAAAAAAAVKGFGFAPSHHETTFNNTTQPRKYSREYYGPDGDLRGVVIGSD